MKKFVPVFLLVLLVPALVVAQDVTVDVSVSANVAVRDVIDEDVDAGNCQDAAAEVVCDDVEAVTPVAEGVAPAAPTAPSPVGDPGQMIEGATNAARAGHWSVFVGFVVMLLVWGVREVFKALNTKILPWMAVGLAIGWEIGAALIGGGEWSAAVVNGFLAGATAVGLWEMLFKHLLAEKKPAT